MGTYVRSFLQEFLLGEIVKLGPRLGKGDPNRRRHQGTQAQLLDHRLQPELYHGVGPLLGICNIRQRKRERGTCLVIKSNNEKEKRKCGMESEKRDDGFVLFPEVNQIKNRQSVPPVPISSLAQDQ